MLAERLSPVLAVFDKPNHSAFAIVVFLLCNLNVNNVARYAEGHEDNLLIMMEYALPLCCHGFDGHVLVDGKWLAVSTHYACFLSAKLSNFS
jgi:hypothetical protein